MRLDYYHKMIIHFLGNRRIANTNEVAENLKISWATANKKLHQLHHYGYVSRVKSRSLRNYDWELTRF